GRMHDAPHHGGGDDEERETVIIERPGQELDLVVLAQFEAEDVHARNPHAAVAAGQVVELEKERVEQHAEGKRQYAEKDADVTNAEKPDWHRDKRPRQHDGDEHDLERGDPELAGEHGGAIGAEAEKHGVTEREQSGVAEEQIKPQQRDGVTEEW